MLGPRILITGTPENGESEFYHTLLNYSLKIGYTPIFCDLDLDNEISIPGCISSSLIDNLVPNDLLFDNSITFFTGFTFSKDIDKNKNLNWSLYKMQIEEMGQCCINELQQDLNNWKKKMNIMNENKKTKSSFVSSPKPTLFSSGLIVNCPIIKNIEEDKLIYQLIITKFDINFIYVIENEKLKTDLKKLNENISVELITGLTRSDTSINENLERQRKINNYFKGPFENFGLKQMKLQLSKFRIIKIVPSGVSSGMVPLGKDSDLKIVFEAYTKDEQEKILKEKLLDKIVCFPYLEANDIQELDKHFDSNMNRYVELFAKATVSYFGYITQIDKNDDKITIYCPNDKPQHKYILVGDITKLNL